MTTIEIVSEARRLHLQTAMRRYKLVFLQLGAVYEPLRDNLLESAATCRTDAVTLAKTALDSLPDTGTVVVDHVEEFQRTGSTPDATLGELRIRVDHCLEAGANVCLVSTAPRCSYPLVPGSSLLDDAKPFYLDLLSDDEVPELYRDGAKNYTPCNRMPSISFTGQGIDEVFGKAIAELGLNVISAIDAAVYESGLNRDWVKFLEFRESEAVRGAGLSIMNNDVGTFAVPSRFSEFREALADTLASITEPPQGLDDIANGLWRIERTIRLRLRQHALASHGSSWRKNVFHGDLAGKVLERARMDTNIAARSVSELRDPIEWLSLGEMLEVVNSSGGLGADGIFWKKLAADLLPIRNRLSHMRLTRKGDRESVMAWQAHVARTL